MPTIRVPEGRLNAALVLVVHTGLPTVGDTIPPGRL